MNKTNIKVQLTVYLVLALTASATAPLYYTDSLYDCNYFIALFDRTAGPNDEPLVNVDKQTNEDK